VVCVSLHKSLSAEINMKIGTASAAFTFHNMNACFNPSEKTESLSAPSTAWKENTEHDAVGKKEDRLFALSTVFSLLELRHK
jgi:hypothetical protein